MSVSTYDCSEDSLNDYWIIVNLVKDKVWIPQ